MTFTSKISLTALTVLAVSALSLPAQAKFETGATLPDMQVTDSNGIVHNLSDFDGKNIVLEWTNHECPYVRKHYNTEYSNMQGLQKRAAAEDVVWLSIISSAEGEQGYVSGEKANSLSVERGAAPTAVLMDAAGTTGRTFSAKTTPHMFVIDKDRTLVYQGAIDSNRSSSPATIPAATNYVADALDAIKAGEAIETAETSPYGCSVKYKRKRASLDTISQERTGYVQYAQNSYGSGSKKKTQAAFTVKSDAEIRKMTPQERAQYNRDLKAYRAAQKKKTSNKAYGS